MRGRRSQTPPVASLLPAGQWVQGQVGWLRRPLSRLGIARASSVYTLAAPLVPELRSPTHSPIIHTSFINRGVHQFHSFFPLVSGSKDKSPELRSPTRSLIPELCSPTRSLSFSGGRGSSNALKGQPALSPGQAKRRPG